MENIIFITEAWVNDSRKRRTYNQNNLYKEMSKNKFGDIIIEFEDLTFSGRGAIDIKALIRWRGFSLLNMMNALVAVEENKHVAKRYKLGEGSTLMDLYNNVPMFSTIHVVSKVRFKDEITLIEFELIKDGTKSIYINKMVNVI